MVEGYKGAQSIFLEIRQYETEFKMKEGFELDPEQPNVDNYSQVEAVNETGISLFQAMVNDEYEVFQKHWGYDVYTQPQTTLDTLPISDPNFKLNGKTPLIFSVQEGKIAFTSLIMAHPLIDPNAFDDKNVNALYYACKSGEEDVVKYLLSLKSMND